MVTNTKTKEQILEQAYITPNDLKLLMPSVGIDNCRKMINDIRIEMENKHLYVPQTKPKVALTKLAIKRFGL